MRQARDEAGKAAGVSGRALLIEARVSSSASYVVPFFGGDFFGAFFGAGASGDQPTASAARPSSIKRRIASARVGRRFE